MLGKYREHCIDVYNLVARSVALFPACHLDIIELFPVVERDYLHSSLTQQSDYRLPFREFPCSESGTIGYHVCHNMGGCWLV